VPVGDGGHICAAPAKEERGRLDGAGEEESKEKEESVIPAAKKEERLEQNSENINS
jgi:hypothetical protein